MHSPRNLTICLGTLLAAAVLAPAVSAAERHASPTGDGDACSAAVPCSVSKAISDAASGDEVIVHPGDYALTTTLDDPADITVHGVAGQQRPRLIFSGDAQEGFRLTSGSTLRHVEVEQTSDSGNPAIFASISTVEQVVAKASGPGPTATIQSSEIRNSIVVAGGTDGRALQTSTSGGKNRSTYRNVTAIATGDGGIAIRLSAIGATGSAMVELVNVIAIGDPAGADVSVRTDSSGAHATLTATHSYLGDVEFIGTNAVLEPMGPNLGIAPVFVDAAMGDYRQAPTSPTVDKGLDNAANGAFDVDGDPRTVGTTDIGADEYYVAPPPPAADETPAPPIVADPAPVASNAFAGVTLVSKRLAATRKAVALKVACPAATAAACSGRATLKTARARLGRATFTVAAGSQATVKVTLTRAGRRLLRGTGRLRARARIEARDGAGAARTALTAVTIRRHR
jgi:hypothetical protein